MYLRLFDVVPELRLFSFINILCSRYYLDFIIIFHYTTNPLFYTRKSILKLFQYFKIYCRCCTFHFCHFLFYSSIYLHVEYILHAIFNGSSGLFLLYAFFNNSTIAYVFVCLHIHYFLNYSLNILDDTVEDYGFFSNGC